MLDDLDRRILDALVRDARMSLKELAGSVGLSSPSVSERLRRLEERRVVRAFTVDIDPQALGYHLQAIVRIRPLPGQMHVVRRVIEEMSEVCECDKVTGEDCFVARLFVRSVEHLDAVVDRLADRAETSTALVKSQPVRRRPPPVTPDTQNDAGHR